VGLMALLLRYDQSDGPGQLSRGRFFFRGHALT
jgi:hypothetical protein